MTKRVREAGEFCWINVMTPDSAGAMAFFDQVFGWSFLPKSPVGQTILVGDGVVGGLFDLDTDCPSGLLPTISSRAHVADADVGSERVRALGGRAEAPVSLGDRGRVVLCQDPNGAAFELWEPIAHPGMNCDALVPGAPSWFETLTTDPDRATTFYTELFGWTAEARDVGGGVTYTTFHRESVPVAGMMQVPMPEIPAHWGVYFTVDDADAAAHRATDAGGQVFLVPTDIPAIGRFCGILSPQGVRFYAVHYLPGVRR